MRGESMNSRRGVVKWLAGGGVLLLMAWSYVELFLSRPIGTGPAGPRLDPKPFARPWSERRVLLLGIGDSITAGLGAKSPRHTFFQRLLSNPEDELADMRGLCLQRVLNNIESKNLAISGSTSQQHEAVLAERLAPQPDDVFGLVVMTSGGNDLIHSYGRMPPRECAMYGATLAQAEPWIASFRQRLGRMVDQIQERFPGGCEIYLGDIYDPTDGVGDAPSVFLPPWPDGLAIHARYNEVIRDCAAARPRVHVVPLHLTFLGHGSHCRQFWRKTYVIEDPYYWYFDNIEDPNDRGYDAIRRVFLETIVQHTTLRPQR